MFKLLIFILFLFLGGIFSLHADDFFSKNDKIGPLTISGFFVEGGIVKGKIPVNDAKNISIFLNDDSLPISKDGHVVFGFHYDSDPDAHLTVHHADGRKWEKNIQIAQRKYNVQRIDGLPAAKVTPKKPEILERIARESLDVKKARKIQSPITFFNDNFIWPVKGEITGIFGSQRILNGTPKQPHYGIDIAAPKGTPIYAPAGGVVIYANPDMYYSGATLILDHGHGLMSSFLHLDDIRVKMGQHLSQGDVIGTVGNSGRSTGAHLDWRINWQNYRLDAQFLVPPMPANTE